VTRHRPPAGFAVREPTSDDEVLLSSFRCSRGLWFEDEVQAFVRHHALRLALDEQSDYRLLLVMDGDRLAACFAHHPEGLMTESGGAGTAVRVIFATRLHLLALSIEDQGRRLDDGRRLSDLIMESLVVDAMDREMAVVLTAVVARGNLRSLSLCQRHGLRSQVAYDARHVRLSGRFTSRAG
jgi:hypothetical protein